MSNTSQKRLFEHTVVEQEAGNRLDQILSQVFAEYSRGFWQKQIKAGHVSINGEPETKPKYAVCEHDVLEARVELPQETVDAPEAIDLNIIHEDDMLLVINKPAGLVVHPGAGASTGTLLNGLLHHHSDLKHLPRAGIVHRLDKDTTGLMVVAKTPEAHHSITSQLKDRTVSRAYQALVYGEVISGGTIDKPIGRHATKRKEMTVTPGGRSAVTHYRVAERFKGLTLLDVNLETGRTHQIRVHMKAVGFPMVGDTVYGKRHGVKGYSEEAQTALTTFPRQALHAKKLSLIHPGTGQEISWEAPLPNDMSDLLVILRQEKDNAPI